MNTTILFKKELSESGELKSASKYFNTIEHLMDVSINPCFHEEDCGLVIPRYYGIDDYKELEYNIAKTGNLLLNNNRQIEWIKNFEYYNIKEIAENTFETWDDSDFYKAPEQAYFIKGRTNSKKMTFDKDCYAPNKKRALEITGNLLNDFYIGPPGS